MRDLSRRRLEPGPETEAYFNEIAGQSDRACAIVLVANVESELADLIRAKFITTNDEEQDNVLFYDIGSVLGTFSDKIEIAYALGLIDKETKFNLHIFRKIRNAFAHTIVTITFKCKLISAEVSKLSLYEEAAGDSERTIFFESCHAFLLRSMFVFTKLTKRRTVALALAPSIEKALITASDVRALGFTLAFSSQSK